MIGQRLADEVLHAEERGRLARRPLDRERPASKRADRRAARRDQLSGHIERADGQCAFGAQDRTHPAVGGEAQIRPVIRADVVRVDGRRLADVAAARRAQIARQGPREAADRRLEVGGVVEAGDPAEAVDDRHRDDRAVDHRRRRLRNGLETNADITGRGTVTVGHDQRVGCVGRDGESADLSAGRTKRAVQTDDAQFIGREPRQGQRVGQAIAVGVGESRSVFPLRAAPAPDPVGRFNEPEFADRDLVGRGQRRIEQRIGVDHGQHLGDRIAEDVIDRREGDVVVTVGTAIAHTGCPGVAAGLQHIRAQGLEFSVEARPDDGIDDRGADGSDAAPAPGAVAERRIEFVGARDAETRRQEAALIGVPWPATARRIEQLTLGVLISAAITDIREVGRRQQILRHQHIDGDAGVALALADLVEAPFEVRLGDGLRLHGHRAEHGQRERAEERGDHRDSA